MLRRRLPLWSVLPLLLLAFGYGYASHWKRIFPYQLHPALAELVFTRLLHKPQSAAPRPSRAAADDRPMNAEELMSLGYAAGYESRPLVEGVTTLEAAAVSDGLNLVVSGHEPGAILMDMKGRVVHHWQKRLTDVWPGRKLIGEAGQGAFWKRVHLFDDGKLLALFEGGGLVKLARDSSVEWSVDTPAHHDLDVDADGNVYVLTKHAHVVPRQNESRPILEDYVLLLDAQGREKKKVSILEAFESSPYQVLLPPKGAFGDLFHTNTLAVIRQRSSAIPALAPGRVLLCLRSLNVVAALDVERGTIVWALTGLWDRPHEPVLLPDGHLLLYDNLGNGGKSQVLEIDPATQEIVWSYKGPPEFFSLVCGVVQRLPNGNTLVTASTEGRAFEVTPAGRVVWDFYNPFSIGKQEKKIATLFEVVRLGKDAVRWLDDAKSEGTARDSGGRKASQ